MAATVDAPRPTRFPETCSCPGQHTLTSCLRTCNDVVVGWLLLAGGATCLSPLVTSVASLLALGGS